MSFSIQKSIAKACTSYLESGNSSQLRFAVEAILQKKNLQTTELGLHRVWLLRSIENLNLPEAKIEKIRGEIIYTWKEKMVQEAPPEMIPTLIEGIHIFSEEGYFPRYKNLPEISVLRTAKKASGADLFREILQKYIKCCFTWNCEHIPYTFSLGTLLHNSKEGALVREFTRGIEGAENVHHFFLRYLPENLKNRLDTLYLISSFRRDITHLKGVLPIQRIVAQGTFSTFLKELPEVRELIVQGEWKEDNLPKERLRSIAFELKDVTVTDQRTRQFLFDFFGEQDWSKPLSARYEPKGWQPVIQPPLDPNLKLSRKKNLILALAPELITKPEAKSELIKASGVLTDNASIDCPRDSVLGPKLLEWIEEMWKNGEISDRVCERAIKNWNRNVGSAPFKEYEIKANDGGTVRLPTFPLRVELNLKQGELPTTLENCSATGLQHVKDLLLSNNHNQFPKYWIEGAKAANELKIEKFWNEFHTPGNPKLWSEEEVLELSKNSPENWFNAAIRSVSQNTWGFDHLAQEGFRRLYQTGWWEASLAYRKVLEIPSDPTSDCQSILEDSSPFDEVEVLSWKNPDFEQAWPVSMICQENLPNLRRLDLGRDLAMHNAPATPFEDLSFIGELPSKIDVVIKNITLDGEKIQTMTQFGKRTRDEGPIYLQDVKFSKCKKPKLEKTPFVIIEK